MAKLMKMQPTLLHMPIEKDIVFTPDKLAKDIVQEFIQPGKALDPCMGDGAFYKYLPEGSEWCEIEKGRDFYAFNSKVNTVIGNPPYSNLLAWIRHSFKIAVNVVYLIPLHRTFASAEFLRDLQQWGGIKHIRLYGTGSDWGFPFGHALGAVHYCAGYRGNTSWSKYEWSDDGETKK